MTYNELALYVAGGKYDSFKHFHIKTNTILKCFLQQALTLF